MNMNCISQRLFSVAKNIRYKNVFAVGQNIRRQSGTSKLKKLIEVIPRERINQRDGRGWTALMMAAREGDMEAIELLMEKGATSDVITHSGHSAYDIAVFWRRENCAKFLKPLDLFKPDDNFFSTDGINRNGLNRAKGDWIRNAVMDDLTEFVLMYKTEPLVKFEGNPSPKTKQHAVPDLFTASYAEVHHLLSDSLDNVIYIGQHSLVDAHIRKKGDKLMEKNIFAIDVTATSKEDLAELYPGAEVLPVYPGLMRLVPKDASIAAQARSILDWHLRYKFCPTCGSETIMTDAGYKRSCTDKKCSTHKEGKSNTCYPRVDPTVLTAVVSRDNSYSLLCRQKGLPHGMYSCLGGFIEPGESIEQACRREVNEEVGLLVHEVTYNSSQPWPMPSTLLLGCTAYTDHTTSIEIDQEELEDARWFTRDDIVLMLMQHHPDGFYLPPRQAIAHRLLNEWLVNTAFT